MQYNANVLKKRIVEDENEMKMSSLTSQLDNY